MAKLNLTYEKKVHLDKWDIDVTPQLTLQEMKLIVGIAENQKDSFERDEAILASVIAACTDIYDNEDAEYTYEEIIYSGLWRDILEACPRLSANIEIIYNKLNEKKTAEYMFEKLVDKLIDAINKVDVDKLAETVNSLIENNVE